MAIIGDARTGIEPDPTTKAMLAGQQQLPDLTSSTPASKPVGGAQPPQPAQWNVTPDQTAEGRIASIIKSDSPLMQAARTKSLETMNGRGLINSSMAAGAGELAAIQAATPIATNDSQIASKAASYNADQQNQFGLKQIELDNTKLLQTNNQAATAFNQAMVAITNINQNDKMDVTAKTQAIATIQFNLRQQLETLKSTSGINLSGELNFAGYPGFDNSGNYIGFPAAPAPAAEPEKPRGFGGLMNMEPIA